MSLDVEIHTALAKFMKVAHVFLHLFRFLRFGCTQPAVARNGYSEIP